MYDYYYRSYNKLNLIVIGPESSFLHVGKGSAESHIMILIPIFYVMGYL